MADPVPGTNDVEVGFRDTIGSRVIWISIIAIIVLGLIAIGGAAYVDFKQTDRDFGKDAKDLLGVLLPVLSTWVGVILAFYFGSQNFQAAHKAALETFKAAGAGVDPSTPVSGAMIQRGSIVSLAVPKDGLGAVALADVTTKFAISVNGTPITRLVFFDADWKAVGIMHNSLWSELRVLGSTMAPPLDPAQDTLAKVLSLPRKSAVGSTYEDYITKSFVFVGIDKTLADAKTALEASPGVQDVMVTQTGKSSEPVLGWLTNTDIERMSTA